MLPLTYRPGSALVVGGTGNVGRGVVAQLARAGLPVTFTYRASQRTADRMMQRLGDEGLAVQALQMDDDAESIRATIAAAEEFGGPLSTFAWTTGGPAPFDNIADVEVDDLVDFVERDALACFRVIHEIVPVLRRNGGGSITLATTIATKRVLTYDGVTPFSRGSLQALVRQLAAEEAPYGIRCNDVAIAIAVVLSFDQLMAFAESSPGAASERTKSVIEQMNRMRYLRQPGTPDDAGNLFAFLASDQAAFITGQSICLDAGISL